MQRAIGSDIMMVLDQCIDVDEPARASRAPRWSARTAGRARSLAARGDSPQALFAIVQGACFEDLRRESAARADRDAGSTASRSAASPSARRSAQREDITELHRGAVARGPAALPDGRRHAARHPRGRASRRRHVRLHHADRVGAARARVHVARQDRPAPRRAQARRAAARRRVRLRGVRALLAVVPASPRSSARSRSAGSCSRTHNLRFYLRLMDDIRAHIAADTFARFYAERRELLARRRSRQPVRAAAARSAASRRRAARSRCTSRRTASRASSTSPSGEVMHSVNAPDVEAERCVRRAVGARSRTALARRRARSSCGTSGSAPRTTRWRSSARSMRAPAHAPVELVSFEHDLDALRLALAHTGPFAHLRHPAPHILAHARPLRARPASRGSWSRATSSRSFASAPQPDVIFYDPFSSKVDARAVVARDVPRAARAPRAARSSCSHTRNSTAIRSSLLAAGFHVARGVASGPKEETTIAIKPGDRLPGHALLGREWLERRARSSAPYPPEIVRAVLAHPQFTVWSRRPSAT